jgi:hypothetical protein
MDPPIPGGERRGQRDQDQPGPMVCHRQGDGQQGEQPGGDDDRGPHPRPRRGVGSGGGDPEPQGGQSLADPLHGQTAHLVRLVPFQPAAVLVQYRLPGAHLIRPPRKDAQRINGHPVQRGELPVFEPIAQSVSWPGRLPPRIRRSAGAGGGPRPRLQRVSAATLSTPRPELLADPLLRQLQRVQLSLRTIASLAFLDQFRFQRGATLLQVIERRALVATQLSHA